MKTIAKNYRQLVKKYRDIEKDSTEKEIHDKRVILRRIFPILRVYKLKLSNVKNGEKAFRLFGKLRDVQVQILKMESIEQTPEIIDYLLFLKELEMKLKLKAEKFSKKKELEFPTLKKNFIVERSKIESRTRKSLNKVVDKIQSRRNDNTAGTHEIRIAFKKFRYNVEVLSYIEKTDEEKLEKLKYFQDKLGEIQDYEVLITGITNYFSTKDPTKITSTELFKQEQNKLIETFDNETVTLLEVCKDMIAIIQNQKSN